MSQCLHCKKEQTKLVRIARVKDFKGNETDKQTITETEVCTNPECWSRINIIKVENWVKAKGREKSN